MSTDLRRRLGAPAIFAGSLLIGAAVGIGGSSLALWNDAEHLTGAIGTGYEFFAVGAPGSELEPADVSGHVGFVLDGPAAAQALMDEGEFAQAIQVDALSQGNKGLQYVLTEPGWGDGILGSADVSVFWVDSPDDCQVGADAPTPPETVDGHTSTPVAATYTTGDEVTTEFWCLQASPGDLPDEGDYTNVGSVTADDPSGQPVDAHDDWSAEVTSAFDPTNEADHTIGFSYQTFRPGATP